MHYQKSLTDFVGHIIEHHAMDEDVELIARNLFTQHAPKSFCVPKKKGKKYSMAPNMKDRSIFSLRFDSLCVYCV